MIDHSLTVTSIPIKDSIHIFCFTIKQAVTKKRQAVGLNHDTWIIWGWPIAYNAYNEGRMNIHFSIQCAVLWLMLGQ